MEINKIFSWRYDFRKQEKDTCVNSSGMNALFGIPYNTQFSIRCEVFNSYNK